MTPAMQATVTFIMVGVLADHEVLLDRLAVAVPAGIMPSEIATAWAGAAKSFITSKNGVHVTKP